MKNDKKTDTSPQIPQKDKYTGELSIREFNWTEKQKEFIKLGLDKDTRIIICKAPPGVGKTLLSTYCALKRLQEKRSSTLYYIRNPVESASKGLGFVPGEVADKMNWVLQPLHDQLSQLLPVSQINKLNADKRIEGIPMGYLKGRTFTVSTLIIDEIEDLSVQELLLAMSRLGSYCQMFLLGDPKQSNIKNSGFTKVFDAFNNEESKSQGIFTFEFTKEDCMRNKITKYIIETFEKMDKMFE